MSVEISEFNKWFDKNISEPDDDYMTQDELKFLMGYSWNSAQESLKRENNEKKDCQG